MYPTETHNKMKAFIWKRRAIKDTEQGLAVYFSDVWKTAPS